MTLHVESNLALTPTPDLARWSSPQAIEPAHDERAQFAAQFIPSGARVLELNCGRMSLRRFLPNGCRYQEKGTRYGRKAQEQAWQSAEVDALYRLAAAGVRVPKPHNFHEGVLLMELVTDEQGNAAPRLNDLELTAEQARAYHQTLLMQVVRMLCAGVVHGDLSEFNVLLGSDGPVIIDLPQAVDAAGKNSACSMLERGVDNLAAYFGRFLHNKMFGISSIADRTRFSKPPSK